MRPYLDKAPKVIGIVKEANVASGIPVLEELIRGPTDGARPSVRGLPCSDVFTGGLNFHRALECIPIKSMENAADVALNLAKLPANVKSLER